MYQFGHTFSCEKMQMKPYHPKQNLPTGSHHNWFILAEQVGGVTFARIPTQKSVSSHKGSRCFRGVEVIACTTVMLEYVLGQIVSPSDCKEQGAVNGWVYALLS